MSSRLGLGFSWEGAFAVVLASHFLGQWAAAGVMRRGDGHTSDSDAGDGDSLKRSLLLAWGGILIGVSICLGIIWRNTGYPISWLCTGIALSVLSSAAGINAVTKHLGSPGARRKLVFGSIVFFFMALGRIAPKSPVFRDTILYLIVSSMFLIRQRGLEVDRSGLVSRNCRWNRGSVVVVAAAMLLAVAFSLGSSAGRQLVSELLRIIEPVLEKTLDIILMPVGYFIQWLGAILQRFMTQNDTDFSIEFDSFLDDLRKLQQEQDGLLTLPLWLKLLLSGTVITVSLVLLWRFISRTMDRAEQGFADESRISLASSGAVKEWFDLTFNEGKHKLAKSLQFLRRLVSGSDPQTLEELYARATEFMSQKGFPRHPTLTPFEYLRIIENHMGPGEISSHLETISVIFSECHYACRKPQEAEWQSALSAYHGLLTHEEWRGAGEPAVSD